jgi:hypothetical protein
MLLVVVLLVVSYGFGEGDVAGLGCADRGRLLGVRRARSSRLQLWACRARKRSAALLREVWRTLRWKWKRRRTLDVGVCFLLAGKWFPEGRLVWLRDWLGVEANRALL